MTVSVSAPLHRRPRTVLPCASAATPQHTGAVNSLSSTGLQQEALFRIRLHRLGSQDSKKILLGQDRLGPDRAHYAPDPCCPSRPTTAAASAAVHMSRRIAAPLTLIRLWCAATFCRMGVPLFRRFVVVFSVLAFLLAGFTTTSVATDVPCGMEMTAAAADGTPCNGRSMPGDSENVPDVSVCFAKCPVPLLGRTAESPAVAYVEAPVQAFRRQPVWAGIGIVPPLEPPRA